MTAGENVSADDLRQILAEVEDKKPTQRLMAAINYLEEDDATQKEIAERYGYTGGWLSQWLTRLERLADEPFENVVYDEHRSGRPADLSEAEHERFVEVLHEPPEEVGIDARAWTVPLAQNYLKERFGVEYYDRHIRRLLTEAGLSRQTARPQYANADERAQEAFREGFRKSHPAWTTTTRS
jgi:transposase